MEPSNDALVVLVVKLGDAVVKLGVGLRVVAVIGALLVVVDEVLGIHGLGHDAGNGWCYGGHDEMSAANRREARRSRVRGKSDSKTEQPLLVRGAQCVHRATSATSALASDREA